MSEVQEVSFYPRYEERLGEDAKRWLATVNIALRNQGVTVDVSKTLVLNQEALNIPNPTKAGVVATLSNHYGLEAIKGDSLPHIYNLKAAVDYEKFDVDPFTAIAEYQGYDWKGELAPFSERIPEHLNLSFNTFADVNKAAVILSKGVELAQEAVAKRQIILDMTPEKWDEYRRGIRWSQSGRAKDIFREDMFVVEKVQDSTRIMSHLYFVREDRWNDMLLHFMELPSTLQLDHNSQLASISYMELALSRVQLSIDRLLVPKKASGATN